MREGSKFSVSILVYQLCLLVIAQPLGSRGAETDLLGGFSGCFPGVGVRTARREGVQDGAEGGRRHDKP